MTGGEDEPKQFVADVLVESGVQIGHRLLLLRRAVAVCNSQAPGLWGMPVAGQCSRAASRASCVKSSASGTSRSILERLVISRGCSIRHTATMLRWMSAAVMAAGDILRRHVLRRDVLRRIASRAGKRTKLARPLPARHMIQVQLHEFLRHRHGLFLIAELEDRVAADHLFRRPERAVADTEFAVRDPHL